LVILVTGGSGFIGSHIVDKLREADHEVRVFDAAKPHREDVDWSKGDLLNPDDVLASLKDVEYLYHLAAVADVNVALARPDLCVRINEIGTLNVLQAALSLEVERVFLASTTWVYGKSEGTVTESTPIPPPDHLYTASKIAQENLVISFNKHWAVPYTIFRFDIPYGPRMRSNMAISSFVRRALNGEPISVFGDGSQGRCFIHVDDLARGNVMGLDGRAKNQTINLAGSEFVTIRQIVDLLGERFAKLNVKNEAPRPGDFRGSRTSIEKAKELIGWTPQVPFSQGLQSYIDYVTAGNVR
jgi:UDP-glucose 4-epimerase